MKCSCGHREPYPQPVGIQYDERNVMIAIAHNCLYCGSTRYTPITRASVTLVARAMEKEREERRQCRKSTVG